MNSTQQSTREINILDFGAVGDGVTVNTGAVNEAIGRAAAQGAQKVTVPPGVFVCGTIRLRSNLTLELMTGAVLLASPNIDDFPQRTVRRGEHQYGDRSRRVFVLAESCENITICGGGSIDGNNEAYAAKKPHERGPHEWFGYVKDSYQPTVAFHGCRNVRIRDITIRNGVRWNIHLRMCDRVWVERVCILNDPHAGNSDGIDIDACRDVFVGNTRIDTGDDAIVLKTLYNTRSCERITISNCILKSTCAAVKVGTESFHDFRHITFANSVVHESPRMVELLTFDGGMIEDVTVTGIACDTRCEITMCRPIHLDASRRVRGYAPLGERGEYRPGEIRRVSIANCTISTDGRILLTGADGAMLRQITLRDIHITMPWVEDPVRVADLSDTMQTSNASPRARVARAVVVAKDIENLIVDGLTVSYPRGHVDRDYPPKIENNQLVRDPRVAFDPLPDFSVLWARNVQGGRVNLCGARPLGEAPRVDIANSSLDLTT